MVEETPALVDAMSGVQIEKFQSPDLKLMHLQILKNYER
jgi:hypothetical protein